MSFLKFVMFLLLLNAGPFSKSVFLLAYFLIFDTLCVCVGEVSNFTYSVFTLLCFTPL